MQKLGKSIAEENHLSNQEHPKPNKTRFASVKHCRGNPPQQPRKPETEQTPFRFCEALQRKPTSATKKKETAEQKTLSLKEKPIK